MKRVLMAESSDIYRDGRVQKEACSLVKAGYGVTVLGFAESGRAKRIFPFKLITLPVAARNRRKLRNVCIFINVGLLNLRILFTRVQVYHAHNTMFLWGMFLASRIYGGRFIFDSHEVQCEAGRLQAWLEKVFIRKADAVINVSEGRADYQALQHSLPREKIIVIHNYPEFQEALWEKRQPTDRTQKLRMVFSGGFNLEDNRLDDFLRILTGIPNVELDLIAFGYGDSGERLKNVIQQMGLAETVKFLPLVPFKKLIPTLRSYDLAVDMLINPEQSVSKRYPAINKTYEYFAAGLPIVCSDMEAFIEEVHNQGAGISINPFQIEEARKRIIELVSDRDKIEKMRATARQLSEKRYNWKFEEDRLIATYSKLLINR